MNGGLHAVTIAERSQAHFKARANKKAPVLRGLVLITELVRYTVFSSRSSANRNRNIAASRSRRLASSSVPDSATLVSSCSALRMSSPGSSAERRSKNDRRSMPERRSCTTTVTTRRRSPRLRRSGVWRRSAVAFIRSQCGAPLQVQLALHLGGSPGPGHLTPGTGARGGRKGRIFNNEHPLTQVGTPG